MFRFLFSASSKDSKNDSSANQQSHPSNSLSTWNACRAARINNFVGIQECIEADVNFNLTATWFEGGWGGSAIFAPSTEKSWVPMAYLGPCSPLMVAVIYSDLELIQLIIEKSNANINYAGGRGKDHTPLDCALKWRKDQPEIIQYLELQDAQKSARISGRVEDKIYGSEERINIRRAIETNDIVALQELCLEKDINNHFFYVVKLDSNLTPLQLATYLGHEDIVNFLLSEGASVNAISQENENLSQRGARFFTCGVWRRKGGYTSLHLASEYQPDCIKMLLANGADYTIKDKCGNFPLKIEQLCNNFSVSPHLISLDLSIYNNFNEKYLDLIDFAFKQGKVQKICINFSSIYLGAEDENLRSFLKLIDILKENIHLREIKFINAKYIIKTYSGQLGSCMSQDALMPIRKTLVRILNALLALSENKLVRHIDFGEIIHLHKEYRTEYYSEYEYAGSYPNRSYQLVQKQRTKTIESSQVLLKLSNDSIAKIAHSPTVSFKQFSNENDRIMSEADAWGRLFSSEESRMVKKIIDPEILVGFCTKLNNTLSKNISSLTADSKQEEKPEHISLNQTVITTEHLQASTSEEKNYYEHAGEEPITSQQISSLKKFS